LAALLTAQHVERTMSRGCADPGARPRLVAAAATMEGEEGILGDVLRPAAIAENACRNCHHAGVFGAEDAIKRWIGGLRHRGRDGHAPDSLSIHTDTAPPQAIL
jgi:hypothetical protein